MVDKYILKESKAVKETLDFLSPAPTKTGETFRSIIETAGPSYSRKADFGEDIMAERALWVRRYVELLQYGRTLFASIDDLDTVDHMLGLEVDNYIAKLREEKNR